MYENKNILVTGGTGMIGSHLVELLLEKNANVRIISHERKVPNELEDKGLDIISGDLTEKKFAEESVKGMDYVFHLAAYTGGLGRTSTHPASTLTPNLIMDGNILESAKNERIDRFLYASCTCIYPNDVKTLEEDDAWKGDPPEVHASYSWSKRMGERQAIAYHKEYGMNIAIVRPSNSYGPRDSDDLETAHALGSLIIKAINKMNPFVIWGDGSPIREYIYAQDAAKGMLLAMENYCVGDPINLASGEFVSISELAQKILKISNLNPEIKFDKEKPSGQKRRVLSNKKAEEKIGFVAETSLDVGIEQTIKWYKQKLGK
jgi:GDP-L-fucose synthase